MDNNPPDPVGLPPFTVAKMQYEAGNPQAAETTLFSNYPSRVAAQLFEEIEDMEPDEVIGESNQQCGCNAKAQGNVDFWRKMSEQKTSTGLSPPKFTEDEIPGYAKWLDDPLGMKRGSPFGIGQIIAWGALGYVAIRLFGGKKKK